MGRGLLVALLTTVVLGTTCDGRDEENCQAVTECDRCTMKDGCLWCAETGRCLPSDAFCNDTVRQPDLCEGH